MNQFICFRGVANELTSQKRDAIYCTLSPSIWTIGHKERLPCRSILPSSFVLSIVPQNPSDHKLAPPPTPQVPASWSKCYPSLKPLGAWMRDLILRAEHIRDWAMVAMPKVFWLPCMTYPTGDNQGRRFVV